MLTTKNLSANPLAEIYFAGGCFWGVEEYFSRIPGVVDAVSGYANGSRDKPTYQDVCTGRTGHAETVRLVYDPARISLATLCRQFFRIIDPLSVNQQGNDRGSQYRTGIYYSDKADRAIIALVMQAEQQKYRTPLAVELLPLTVFFVAEDYHQNYLRNNPHGYCHISFASLKDLPKTPSLDAGRYRTPDAASLRALSPEAYAVTQQAATEPPFSGKYLHQSAQGLYVDIVTGEPLFLTSDQFDSGTGWPSFRKPVDPSVITETLDRSHGMLRREVRSRVGGSHLGHVFDDGPKGSRRYCINSAALRFIPLAEMAKAGFEDLLPFLNADREQEQKQQTKQEAERKGRELVSEP